MTEILVYRFALVLESLFFQFNERIVVLNPLTAAEDGEDGGIELEDIAAFEAVSIGGGRPAGEAAAGWRGLREYVTLAVTTAYLRFGPLLCCGCCSNICLVVATLNTEQSLHPPIIHQLRLIISYV